MLQKGIHVAIVETIVFLCSQVGTERKKTWPGPDIIYDHDSWVAAGSPNPTGSISRSSIPEIHPFTLLRILKDFFDLSDISEKVRRSITRGRRENTDMIMGSSWLRREDSIMELFNGWRYDGNGPNRSEIYGGLSTGDIRPFGPASSRYLNSEDDEDLDLDKYEVKKDSLNIYEEDKKFDNSDSETKDSIDESAVSSDWTKFATDEDQD